MALPAQDTVTGMYVLQRDVSRLNSFRQYPVTSDTVFLDSFHASIFDMNDLRLKPEREHTRMTETVLSFEQVSAQYIVLGNVAIVARRDSGMTAALPGCVLRRHDVAVDTGGGIVGKVGKCITGV